MWNWSNRSLVNIYFLLNKYILRYFDWGSGFLNKLTSMQKRILCFIGLGVIFILMGNSNNSPEIFIQRIFKPISRNNSTFNYSGFIVMVNSIIA